VVPVAAGPFLMLQLRFLDNIAFVNTMTGMSLAAGTATALAAETGACGLMALGRERTPRLVRGIGAVSLALLAWAIPTLRGPMAAAVVIVATGLAGMGLSISMSRGGEADRPGSWRTAFALGGGMLTFVALVFAHQIHATSHSRSRTVSCRPWRHCSWAPRVSGQGQGATAP
jgi:hypothetical protein